MLKAGHLAGKRTTLVASDMRILAQGLHLRWREEWPHDGEKVKGRWTVSFNNTYSHIPQLYL
jgi:hypothetical protein